MFGDIMIYADTKIYKNNQTAIPSKIRKECNIGPDDIIEWVLDDDGKVTKVSFKEMRGSIDLGYKTNSVELEKELYE